jgi:glycosyltransferase involved in cell wall biosynthesis
MTQSKGDAPMADATGPLVTVVIPTRHRPEMVCRAVRSALCQTYANLEVVVVVDGPDSATVEALEALDEQRLRIVALPESVGGSEARNTGIRAANGTWVALLDDDDEWLPLKIGEQMRLVPEPSGENVLVACRYYHRAEQAADIIRPRKLPKPRQSLGDYLFDFGCGFQTSGYLCTRSLAQCMPFDPQLIVEQDTDWMLRLALLPHLNVIAIEEPLYIYNAPESRPTISSRVSWQIRLNYATTHRRYFTNLAYSRFLFRSCIRRAIGQKARWREILPLAREFFWSGRPELKTTAAFLLVILKLR